VILPETSPETSEQIFYTNVASEQKKILAKSPTTVTVQIRRAIVAKTCSNDVKILTKSSNKNILL
jgi:hypothetical protein